MSVIFWVPAHLKSCEFWSIFYFGFFFFYGHSPSKAYTFYSRICMTEKKLMDKKTSKIWNIFDSSTSDRG